MAKQTQLDMNVDPTRIIVTDKPMGANLVKTVPYYAFWRSDTEKFLQDGVDQETRAPYKWGDYVETVCTAETIVIIDEIVEKNGDDYEPLGILKQNPFIVGRNMAVFVPVAVWGCYNELGVIEIYFEPDFLRSLAF